MNAYSSRRRTAGKREIPVRSPVLAILILALALSLSRGASGQPSFPESPLPPPRPSGGAPVAAGTDLQAAVDSAPAGAVLLLEPGTYAGPLVLRKPVTLWGPRTAVVRSNGSGTTVDVRAAGARLLGFTVDGSGQRFDKTEAAVHVTAAGAEVRGLRIRHALFGIVAEESSDLTLADNLIEGDAAAPLGLRGDGIRLWETRDSVIRGNRLDDVRDMVVWYSPGNRVLDNVVVGSRYATHFMYSSDSEVRGNRYVGNIVGVFVMYSHDITARRNLIGGNVAPDGMGFGVKESGNLTLADNLLVQDRQGLYLDTSPYRKGDRDLFEGNTFAFCDAAVTFHSSEKRNEFLRNNFMDNARQVVVEGRGNAMGVLWEGNYFDDYRGYDLDGDGTGDVPYELRSLSDQLAEGYPSLAFFRGSPAMGLLDTVSEIFPLFAPRTLLRDSSPRMRPLPVPAFPGEGADRAH